MSTADTVEKAATALANADRVALACHVTAKGKRAAAAQDLARFIASAIAQPAAWAA